MTLEKYGKTNKRCFVTYRFVCRRRCCRYSTELLDLLPQLCYLKRKKNRTTGVCSTFAWLSFKITFTKSVARLNLKYLHNEDTQIDKTPTDSPNNRNDSSRLITLQNYHVITCLTWACEISNFDDLFELRMLTSSRRGRYCRL